MDIPEKMRAMVLEAPEKALRAMEVSVPRPGPQQVLIKVNACGVCRTDLHILDGELPNPKLPLIPGHEIVGTVIKTGDQVEKFSVGNRVGVPWLGYTCMECRYCKREQENLCDSALFTGYTIDGGYAEYTIADQRYCFHIPNVYGDAEAAPLLCAGLIGYRSYRMIGQYAERIGIYGFGAAWAGDSTVLPPEELDAAIIFAPVGSLLPAALRATAKGGTVVCGGIHMSDIPSFPYRILWEERIVRSVANLTLRDGEELLAIAPKIPVKTEAQVFPLGQANKALDMLRQGKIQGASVLLMSSS